MKTLTAVYKGNRTIEMSEELDLPEDTAVLVLVPEQESEPEVRRQLQSASEVVFAKLWDDEEDELWNEYL